MAHPHPHDHSPARELTSKQTRRLLAAVVGFVALLALVGMFLLRPEGERPDVAEELGLNAKIVDASVTAATEVPCTGTVEADGILCLQVDFEVTSGATNGTEESFQTPITEASVRFGTGDKITLGYQANADGGFQYYFNDFQRRTPLRFLVGLFAVAVLALGRFQGLRALLALGITGVVMLAFMFPSILHGHDPTAVALVGAAVIAIVALYLTHGIGGRPRPHHARTRRARRRPHPRRPRGQPGRRLRRPQRGDRGDGPVDEVMERRPRTTVAQPTLPPRPILQRT